MSSSGCGKCGPKQADYYEKQKLIAEEFYPLRTKEHSWPLKTNKPIVVADIGTKAPIDNVFLEHRKCIRRKGIGA